MSMYMIANNGDIIERLREALFPRSYKKDYFIGGIKQLYDRIPDLCMEYSIDYSATNHDIIQLRFCRQNMVHIMYVDLYELEQRYDYVNFVQELLNGVRNDLCRVEYSKYWVGKEERKTSMKNLKDQIVKVKFNDPATIIFWKDGTKTVVKRLESEVFDPEKGLAMAIAKRALGGKGNYYNIFREWLPKEVANHK